MKTVVLESDRKPSKPNVFYLLIQRKDPEKRCQGNRLDKLILLAKLLLKHAALLTNCLEPFKMRPFMAGVLEQQEEIH